MKQFKKLFAGILALCMLFTFMPAVMAEDTGTIEGDTKLYAPPVGQYSKVKYVLKDAEGKVVPDAKLVLAYAHPGVSVEGDCLVLNGSTIKSGFFRMHAESADGTIVSNEITPEVYTNRIYLDMENGTIDSPIQSCGAGYPLVLNTGERYANSIFQDLKNAAGTLLSSTIKADSTGNKYAFADDGIYARLKPSWFGLGNATASTYVIQTDLQKHGQYATAQFWNIFSYTGNTIKFDYKNSDHTYEIVNTYDKDGNKLEEANYLYSGKVLGSSWKQYRLELDFRNKTYSVYYDGVALWEDYTMPSNFAINYGDDKIDIYTKFDDFAVYSGTPYVPEIPYEIEGTGNIYLPTGKAAAVPFVLKNKSDGSVVSDAVYSVSGSGTEMLADGRLLVNGNTPAGTIVISAYSPSDPYQSVATKTVTVQSAKWFYDFESYNVGDNVAHMGSAGDTPTPGKVTPNWQALGAVQAETDEDGNIINKYFGFADGVVVGANETVIYHQLLNLNKQFSNKTTVEFDLLINEATDKWHSVISAHNGLSITYNNSNLKYAYDKDGNAKDIYFILGKGIHHIRMELGYETFSIWANGKLWLDDYKYPKSQKGHISQIIWRSCIDNLMLYDGGEYSIMSSTSADLLEIPGADSNSYTFSSVYSDGSAVSKELTYALAEEYEGVSLEGNVLTVSKTAELVPIILNITDGFANGTVKKHVKTDYILVNDEIYTEGEDVINAAGTYTIKAGYGFSDQKISGSMYIAQYEGGKLVKVIPVNHDGETPINLSAVLSENFSETGTARVFIWNGDMSPIKSDVTIQ